MSTRAFTSLVTVWVLFAVLPVVAGSYKELKPGVSTRADADRFFGAPLREIVPGERYDYTPDNDDTRRISIRFDPEGQVIREIDIYPAATYFRDDFHTWFELDDPDRTEYNADGNLVEYYDAAGIVLRYAGFESGAAVTFFRHFAPPEPDRPSDRVDTGQAIPEGARAYLGISYRADETQGLRIYQVMPGSAAERGGLRVGDVILEFEDASFYGSADTAAFQEVLVNATVSRPVRFLVERGRQRIELYTTLDLRTKDSTDHQMRLESRKAFEQAMAFVEQKKWAEAIPHLERATTLNYRDARAHELLGYCRLKVKRFEQALVSYRSAARVAPDSPVYTYWIAVSLDRMGNREKAIETYEAYLQSEHANRKMMREARRRAEFLRTAPQREAEREKGFADMIDAIRKGIEEADQDE